MLEVIPNYSITPKVEGGEFGFSVDVGPAFCFAG